MSAPLRKPSSHAGPPLFIELYALGPRVEIRFWRRPPSPEQRTHGEGNCVLFGVIDHDATQAFTEALLNGRIAQALGDRVVKFDVTEHCYPSNGWVRGRKRHYYGSRRCNAGSAHPGRYVVMGAPRGNFCLWCGKAHPDYIRRLKKSERKKTREPEEPCRT